LASLLHAALPGGQAEEPREAVQALQNYIGGWEGSGTSEKNKNDPWKESASWSWRFEGKDAWLVLDLPDGKRIKKGELRYLADKKRYQLTAVDEQGKKPIFEGTLKKGRLILERLDPATKETQQVLINMLGDLRFIMIYSTKPEKGKFYNKQYQVVFTKVRQKLYITNGAGDDITVVDVATHKVIGRIEVGPRPHGIAVPKAQNVVLVTVEGGKQGELVWIDPLTDKVTRRMPVGPEPNQLAVTPDGKFAYVPANDGYFEIVDLGKAKIIERLFTGGRPHNTVCSANGKHMYLAPMGNSKKVTIVDVATHKPIGFIPFTSVVRPIALTVDEKRLFAQVDGLVGFEQADVEARKMIHRVPAELTPEQKKIASRSHGLAVRPDQKELWECDVEHHEVHVYDITGDRPKQVATVPMGGSVYWLTFSPDGKHCYVSVLNRNEVAVVDTTTRKITTRIPTGKAPKRLIVVTLPQASGK
jgi:YVTN family beta-propeller protein